MEIAAPQSNIKMAGYWAVICIGVYFLIVMHVVIPNNGGTDGDNLPWVITGWLSMCLLMGGVWLLIPAAQTWRITSTFKGLLFATILLTLPIFWSPNTGWQYHAIPRLAGLWGGLALYFTFLQCRLTDKQWRLIFGMIAISAFIQVLFVIAEIYFSSWVPELSQVVTQNGKLGFGVFEQRNVTASYIATGLVISAIGYVSLHRNSSIESALSCFSGISIVLSSVALVLSFSRVGILGLAISMCALLLAAMFHPQLKSSCPRMKPLVVLITVGFVLGGICLHFEPAIFHSATRDISKDASNIQRWLTLKASLRMFLQSPWFGWGYGGFEYNFQHWVADQLPPIPSREMMNHPHNEIVFWAVEGGVTAIVGLIVMTFSVLHAVIRGFDGYKALVFILMLPVLLHTQTEYPLYQSMAHWLILLLALACLDQEAYQSKMSQRSTIKQFTRVSIAVLSVGGVVLGGVALHNEIILTDFEMSRLPDSEIITRLPLPWLAHERMQQDLALLGIVRFEQDNNPAHLQDSVIRTHRLLQTRTDADMYNNMINMQRYLGNTKQASLDEHEAARLFSYDRRFK